MHVIQLLKIFLNNLKNIFVKIFLQESIASSLSSEQRKVGNFSSDDTLSISGESGNDSDDEVFFEELQPASRDGDMDSEQSESVSECKWCIFCVSLSALNFKFLFGLPCFEPYHYISNFFVHSFCLYKLRHTNHKLKCTCNFQTEGGKKKKEDEDKEEGRGKIRNSAQCRPYDGPKDPRCPPPSGSPTRISFVSEHYLYMHI